MLGIGLCNCNRQERAQVAIFPRENLQENMRYGRIFRAYAEFSALIKNRNMMTHFAKGG